MRVGLARAPLPEGDPRHWLVDELIAQGAAELPTLLMAGTSSERLVATGVEPEQVGLVERALRDLDGVRWTGGWGTALVSWHGRPVMVSFVRLRWRDGSLFLRAWPRIPGARPETLMAESHQGGEQGVPAGLRALVPVLAPGDVAFRDVPLTPPPWPPPTVERAPDLAMEVPPGAADVDVATLAAHALEARFVTEGEALPAVVAWGDGRLLGWWVASEDDLAVLHDIAWRLARDRRTLAVGLFGLGDDTVDGESVPMIALLLEPRHGSALMWLRRFRPVGEGGAEWIDDGGFVRRPVEPVGWFDQEG